MTIKSDKWIRRMVRETGMIEPYEPDLVREIDGARVVSFGTSSYGYDIRCSEEFKIFTNINSAVVDPKNFSDGSFVDFEGGCLHYSTQLVCTGSNGRIFTNST